MSPSADRAGSKRRLPSSSCGRTGRASRLCLTWPTRRRWRSTRRAAARVQPLRRQRSSGRPGRHRHHRCDGPRGGVRPRVRAGRHALRGRPFGVHPSGLATGARRFSPRCRQASRRFTWPSARTDGSTSRRRHSARATACTGSRPTASSTVLRGFGRPQGLAFDAQRRPVRRRCARGRQRRLPPAPRPRREPSRSCPADRSSAWRSIRGGGLVSPPATPSSSFACRCRGPRFW